MSDTLVFVGPTLPATEVATRLPGARVLPPVAVGDVLRVLKRGRVRRIAIIDGYFERMAAVWHKELLLALERGIEVWGAASMGALRAAELAPFGMRGIGVIYRAFASGELSADDEVAVAHLPAEYGYRAVSEALVNLRDGIALAPMLTAKTRAALVELARARFYRERSWDQLLTDARAAGLPARQLAAFATWPKPDRKAADARLLVRTLARMKPTRPRAAKVPRTWALRQLEAWLAGKLG
ncbi:MAG: TfuA-like protein [Kofleriaceae bacterium]|nr:TfuA-like protein [Kofleriaceae bacterium]